MKRFSVLLMVTLMLTGGTWLLLSGVNADDCAGTATEAKPAEESADPGYTQEIITIATPKRKKGGTPTEVILTHKKHTEKAPEKCEACHPALAPELGADGNTMSTVHKSCRQCHAKGKSAAELASCDSCHTLPQESSE